MTNCDSKYCACLYYSTNALSRIMTKIANEEFSITGLSSSYAFLLMIVNEKPGIQPTEISKQMQLTPSTVTRLIEKMEYRDFLVRDHLGKTTKVFPKQSSIDLDSKIKQAWQKLHKRYSAILGKEEGANLTSAIYTASQILA